MSSSEDTNMSENRLDFENGKPSNNTGANPATPASRATEHAYLPTPYPLYPLYPSPFATPFHTGHIPQPYYQFPPQTPVAAPLRHRTTSENATRNMPNDFRPSSTGFDPDSMNSPSLDSAHTKLEHILHTIRDERWTVGTFLHYFSRVRDEDGNKISNRSRTHAQMLSQFLRGKTKYTSVQVVRDWVQSPLGIPNKSDTERNDMFSCTKPFELISCARPALTSFAAQLVQEHLISTVTSAVSEEGGLHTFTSGAREIGDIGYGKETLEAVMAALKENVPLFWHYCVTMATPYNRSRLSRAKNAPPGARAASRNYQPPELVAVHAISSICYSRNRNAKLLPADKALLMFACRANRYLFSHESRIGGSISYNATMDMLEKYAAHDAEAVLQLARSDEKSGILRFDNMQKQVKPRYQRIGREAVMLIGCAGTYCEGEGSVDNSLSLEEKREWVAKNLREKLTFEDLWDLVDHSFLADVLPLVWLEILFLNNQEVPEFSGHYAEKLQVLYTQIGTKHKVSPRQTKIYPLKSNGFNETMTTELKQALLDFFGQLGQTSESFLPRLILAGGDGLTYERMIQLKNYLQFQDDEFERMEILEPFLEIWHTIWTNLSRIYEAHWVGLTSADPSTIGFGANTLKRKAPGNVGKVDFYPYVDLLDTQVEARILDIWSNDLDTKDIFSKLEEQSNMQELPTFEEFHQRAANLQNRFGTRNAFHHLMSDGAGYKEGSTWTPRANDDSSVHLKPTDSKRKGKKKATKEVAESVDVFNGDETLARSTRLINDGLLSKLVNSAVRRGDVGCVWECMKMMTFTFAGSSHTKYTGYLLEMVCNFELEASPELRGYFFNNWLISTNGRTYEPGDLFQEQLQEEIYEHVDHDQGFDSLHTRARISPNVYRFKQSKVDDHAGLGLAARSRNHYAPSRLADIRKLMSRYQLEAQDTVKLL